MNSNKLKLNTDKTEVMPVGSSSRLESVDSESVNTGGNSVPFKTSVKYLGVHLDRTLSMQQHITSIYHASFLELRRIASVRPYLSQSAAARLVATMLISRLHYCNSVFKGLPADQTARLQRVQNNAARLIMKKKKTRSRNTASQGTLLATRKIPLPVQDCDSCLPPFWRVFISLFFFISLHLWTVSLSRSLCTYEPSRSLRSSNEKLLKILKRNIKSLGQRCFCFMAPSLWNSLPATLRNVPTLPQIKYRLKTLFAQVFQ